MRKIKFIVLHCSDSDRLAHDDIATIREWHTLRGFTGPDGVRGTHDDVGYHFFIRRDGTVEEGRKVENVGAHVQNHNKFSIGVCLSGRTFVDFHSPQFTAARKLVRELLQRFNLAESDVKLHRQLDSGKTCPNFTLAQFWKENP